VSYVARLPEVRQWLIPCQRNTSRLGIVVLEGRDIGTVIFPGARFKFFLTASPRERARRRLAQKGETLDGASVESVARNIARRDQLDSTRAAAPLRPADDAVIIDTDPLTEREVVECVLAHIREELP
jgi:cytidylate kinase